MFDIEASIANWRRNLLARESLRPEDADELEDHLRQELEHLSTITSSDNAALSIEEAFVIATRRLGRTDVIAEEFAKTDPGAEWRRRWTWMLCGYIGFGMAFSLIVATAGLAFAYARAGAVLKNALFLGVIVLGIASIVWRARPASRSESTLRLRRLLAGRLKTTRGIVVCTLLAIAAKAALTPLGLSAMLGLSAGMQERLPDGTVRPISIAFMQYTQASLWLAPFAALAILIWLDRERFRRDELSLMNGESD
jgi:hypothetical protein